MFTEPLHLPAASTALLCIDLQRDFLDPAGYAARAGLDVARLRAIVPQVAALLAAARGHGLFVAHTREGHGASLRDLGRFKRQRSAAAGAEVGSTGPLGRLLVRWQAGHDFIDELYPEAGESVIDKPGYSAFTHTDLEWQLRCNGIDTLIVCGVTTEVCVHSTIRHATDLGFRCVLAGDGCAASQPELQAPALAMIGVEGGIFGRVAAAGEIIDALAGDNNKVTA